MVAPTAPKPKNDDPPVKVETQDPTKVVVTESHPISSAYAVDPSQITAVVKPKVKPVAEYTSSRPKDLTNGMVQALPRYIDDITRDFGWDLYERMMLDPQVSSIIDVLRMGACYNGFQFTLPEDVAEGDAELADTIVEFIQYNMNSLDRPFKQLVYELSAGIYLGHKVGEKIFVVEELDPKVGPQLLLSGVHTKPGNSTAFVVDDKNNPLGLMSTIPGKFTATTFIVIGQDGQIDGLIPRDKFIVFTNDPENGDPRGTSLLRAVYQEWWMKMQLKPVYLQFLATQAIPSIHGELQPDAEPYAELDPLSYIPTGRELDPGVQMKQALETVQNGGVIVTPNGANVSLLQGSGVNTGAVFTTAFDMFDRHIAKGISKQTMATEETKHQSHAASSVQQDVLAMPTERITQNLCETLREDLVRPLVLYNYGPDAARRLCPLVQSQEVNQQDFATASSGFASLATAGILDTTDFAQVSWVMQVLGGPAPDEQVFAEKAQAAADAQDAMTKAALAPVAETKPTASKGKAASIAGKPTAGQVRPGESKVAA